MSIAESAPAGTGPPGVADLVKMLRSAGFTIGTSEAADATRLLLILAETDPALSDDLELRLRLRPVFCKTREEQERFDPVFADWIARIRAHAAEVERKKKVVPSKPRETPAREPRTHRTWLERLQVILPFVLIAAFIGIAILTYKPTEAPQKTPEAPRPAAQAPAAQQPLAAPTASASSAAIDRYVPAVRGNLELRTGWVWVLIVLPLIAFFGISLPALVLSRTRLRRSGDPMYLNMQPLAISARRLVPPLGQDIGDRLARHIYSTGLDMEHFARRPVLDVRGTLEATARNYGVPTLRFSYSRVHPSYLLLIDAANESDPRGRLFFQWAERMQREGLEVEIFSIRRIEQAGKSAVEFAPLRAQRGAATRWKPLARLKTPPFGQRLMILSDGDPLADAAGSWREAATRARLYRWRDRALFTPVEPRDWAAREEAIERKERASDLGFIVLPLEESALAAWTNLVLTGRLSMIQLSDPQRFPALLRGAQAAEFTGEAAPHPERLQKLVDQLHVYLGQWGYYWLAACAVPPLIRWELTLILGDAVLKGAPLTNERAASEALARYYRRLVRLPWMRRNAMPEWLRLQLLAELPSGKHRELQELVRHELQKLDRQRGTDGVELNFERPPGSPGALKHGADDTQSAGDGLYLGYVSGLTPEQLLLRAPSGWSKWASSVSLRRPQGVRGWFARLRDHTAAAWSRLVWNNGLPHLGISRRGLALAGWLAVPLIAVVLIATRSSNDPSGGIEALLFQENGRSVAWRMESGGIRALNFDGSKLAVVRFGSLELWDTRTGMLIAQRPRSEPSLGPSALTFSADGERLIGVFSYGEVRYWSGRDLKELGPPARLPLLENEVLAQTSFSTDGARLATATGPRVVVWDLATLREIAMLAPGPHPLQVRKLHLRSSGNVLLAFAGADEAWAWNVDSGDLIPGSGAHLEKLADGDFANPDALQFALSAECGCIASTSRTGLGLWTVSTGRLYSIQSLPVEVAQTVFTPDGARLLTIDQLGNVTTWSTLDGHKIDETPARGLTSARRVLMSADGHRLVWSDTDDVVDVWSAYAANQEGEPITLPGAVTQMEFSPDGTELAVATGDATLSFWNARTHRNAGHDFRINHEVDWLGYGPGGTQIATCGGLGIVRLWTVATGEMQREIDLGLSTCPGGMALSADKLAASDQDGFQLWDLATGRLLVTRPGLYDGHVRFNSAGTQFLVNQYDKPSNALTIVDAQTSSEVRTIELSENERGVAFSPDGARVVAAGNDRVRVWNISSGKEEIAIDSRDANVKSIEFSADGKRLLGTSSQGSAYIWDANTGAAIGTPFPGNDIKDLAPLTADLAVFDSNGEHFVTQTQLPGATGNLETHLQFWRIDPPDPRQLEPTPESFATLVRTHVRGGAMAWWLAALAVGAFGVIVAIPFVRRRKLVRDLLAEQAA